MKEPKIRPFNWKATWEWDSIQGIYLEETKCNLCDKCRTVITATGQYTNCLYGGPFHSYYEENK